MIEIMMALSALPAEAGRLPEGFLLRPFRPGDEKAWEEIQESTGIYGTLADNLFGREFGGVTSDHAGRILFAEKSGEVVGVSAAWHPGAEVLPTTGRVHWVAVKPPYQRRGLGRALVMATLSRLHALGYAAAYLTTGSKNAPAISLYRGLGFEPVPRSPAERAAWERMDRR